jgi:hypothetical protein
MEEKEKSAYCQLWLSSNLRISMSPRSVHSDNSLNINATTPVVVQLRTDNQGTSYMSFETANMTNHRRCQIRLGIR